MKSKLRVPTPKEVLVDSPPGKKNNTTSTYPNYNAKMYQKSAKLDLNLKFQKFFSICLRLNFCDGSAAPHVHLNLIHHTIQTETT